MGLSETQQRNECGKKKKEMSVECTRKLLLEGAKLESQFLGLDQICLNLY